MGLKVYTARGMSGRVKKTVVREALRDKRLLEAVGITVLDPVTEEGVEASDETLMTTVELMDKFWRRDKEMIRQAHVVFDMTPQRKSEGVAHELGYARYSLWKPVIRVFPHGKLPAASSVAFYEDDYVTDDLAAAVVYANDSFGTWRKRAAVEADVYIDDSPSNFAKLKAAGKNVWLYRQGWNKHVEDPNAVNNWTEIYLRLNDERRKRETQ
jgi:hypothetical protein